MSFKRKFLNFLLNIDATVIHKWKISYIDIGALSCEYVIDIYISWVQPYLSMLRVFRIPQLSTLTRCLTM